MTSDAREPGSIMLDSASLEDVRVAVQHPYVSGVTVNPSLIAKVSDDPLAHLSRLLECSELPVFYQPSQDDPDGSLDEVRAAMRLRPAWVIPKVPLTVAYLPLLRQLHADATPFAVTAVYTPAQAVVAHELEAGWIIPYVDRATRLASDGQLVATLRMVLDRIGSSTRILAASLKSTEQVVAALVDGADSVTAPLHLLTSLFEHPLTRSAVEEFVAARGRSKADAPDSSFQ